MVQEFAKGSGGWVLKKLAKLCCSAVALAAVAGADCCSPYPACPSSVGTSQIVEAVSAYGRSVPDRFWVQLCTLGYPFQDLVLGAL